MSVHGCRKLGRSSLMTCARVGGSEFVGLDEVPEDRDAEGNGADDRSPQVRVVGGDGLGDLRLVADDAGEPAVVLEAGLNNGATSRT
jgi:hypothetical protein